LPCQPLTSELRPLACSLRPHDAMKAWLQFTLAELRPLYAVAYAVFVLVHRLALESYVLGARKNEECWFSASYYDCAASCGAYWFFKGCECKDTFQYCQAWREADGSGRTLRERPVPDFVANDGMRVWADVKEVKELPNTADNVSDAWVNANNPSAWLGSADAAFHHLVRNATYPQVFHWYSDDYWQQSDSNTGDLPPLLMWLGEAIIFAIWAAAMVLFLRALGPNANLNGAYVRFCLRLERGRFFRRMIIAVCTLVALTTVPGIVIWWLWFDEPPRLSELCEVAFLFTALRGMLLTDSEFVLDVDDPAFDEVEFNFLPFVVHGVDEAIHDLTAAVVRRRIDPKTYEIKMKKYVKRGGEGLRVVGDADETSRTL